MALTLRTIKGSRLTHEELDGNFRHFTGSHEVSGSITAVTYYGDGSNLTGISGGSATAFPYTGEAQITGSVKVTDKVEVYNKAGGLGNIFEISAGSSFGNGFSGFRFTKNTHNTVTNNAHAAFNNLILQVEDGVFHMYRGGAGAGPVVTMKSADGHVSASLFSGSFHGDGSNLTGIVATGGSALEGTGYVGTAAVDFSTDPSLLKRDNLIIRNANVTISVPPASNYALGTVVEFDIYIPTGSTWTLACQDTAGNYQPGFMQQGHKGFDQLDFNPNFNVIGSLVQFGYSGFYNASSSQFGDLNGDAYHEGPALVRMVAVTTAWNNTSPVTPSTGASGYLWAVRILSRQGMSDSPGTNLAVEVVTALPSANNAKGDLVIYDDGLSGPRLHFYDGSGWEQL